MKETDKPAAGTNAEDVSTRLSRQRTTLSFQRTRLSADRTLMSIIRTSLSLIGFGFTIFQFFRSLKDIGEIEFKRDPNKLAGNTGLAMVSIGIFLLFMGITYHIAFMRQVRKERLRIKHDDLLTTGDTFPISMTLITAILLLMLGLYLIFKMAIS